jgi:CTD small phosphatase-like protein 2
MAVLLGGKPLTEVQREHLDYAVVLQSHLDGLDVEMPTPRKLVCPEARRKKTLCLDLDETLIHFSVEACGPSEPDAIVTAMDGSWGRVYLRPGVHRFLYQASCMFELILFTAANRDYAEQVLPVLDAENCLFQAAYTRDDLPELYGAVLKDLRRAGRPLHEVVLIDDQLGSFVCQPDNGIVIPPYDPCAPCDTGLADLADILLQVYHADDVRAVCPAAFPLQQLFDIRAEQLRAEAAEQSRESEQVEFTVEESVEETKCTEAGVGRHLSSAQGQLAPSKWATEPERRPLGEMNR